MSVAPNSYVLSELGASTGDRSCWGGRRHDQGLGAYDRREVLVSADSGYDDKKIEKAIADKRWNFINPTTPLF